MKHLCLIAISATLLTAAGCSKPEAASDAASKAAAAASDVAANVDTAASQNAANQPDSAVDSAAAAASWMAANAEREGVQTTETGLQYLVTKSGEGESPKAGDMVTVNYEGKLTNGDVFDSSYARGKPATFPSDRLVAGWVEALAMMKPGDDWMVFVPPHLGYGERDSDPIPGNSVMVFRLELLEFTPK